MKIFDKLNDILYIFAYAPIFLIFYSLLKIWKYSNSTIFFHAIIYIWFLTSLFINSFINFILKLFIQQPRPTKLINDNNNLIIHHIKTKWFTITNPEIYGMPSGHAQMSFFISSFISFYFSTFQYIFFIISIFVCIQRVVSYRHTISQVIVGSILGIICGWICFRSYEYYLQSSPTKSQFVKHSYISPNYNL